jgi:hypothetical protein
MVCYGARVSAIIAAAGIAAYVFWHAAIGHIIRIAGLVVEITLIAGASAAVAVLVAWSARAIQRRRAAAGACINCRFSCQQSLAVPAPDRQPQGPRLQPQLRPARQLLAVQGGDTESSHSPA